MRANRRFCPVTAAATATARPAQCPANIYGLRALGVEYLVSISACGSLAARAQAGRHCRARPSFRPNPGPAVQSSTIQPWARAAWSSTYPSADLLPHPQPRLHGCCRPIQATLCTAAACSSPSRGRVSARRPKAGSTSSWVRHRRHDRDSRSLPGREAGMSYATMAHVTDYDVWHETEQPVRSKWSSIGCSPTRRSPKSPS